MKAGFDRARQFTILPLLVWALMGALLLGAPTAAEAKGEPLSDDPYADAMQVAWEDGDYLVNVSMAGGSGRASVSTPAEVSVKGGKAAARIVWSSPNYDYMVVAGKTYVPVNEDGNSVFLIPVLSIDEPFDVVGDTTAMSQPHEVSYQLLFDSASAVEAGTAGAPGHLVSLPVIAVCVALFGICLAVATIRRNG